MSWKEILGHKSVIERFRKAVANQRLASTYLFVGPNGIGKKRFAYKLAQALFCETHSEKQLEACGECPSCQQVAAGTHPDLMSISKPKDKNVIPVSLLIGTKEKRMREGLCYDISRKAFRGGRKIAIIDDADYFNQESANALLKTLEEPPPHSILILIATGERKQLPTIRSRSQVVRFSRLSTDEVAQILRENELIEEPTMIETLAEISSGSVRNAIDMADPEFLEFRGQLLEQLASKDPTNRNFSKTMETFVDAAGKDASLRRQRLRRICDIAIEFYRDEMIESGDTGNANYSDCIDRCLDAQYHSTANMNQSTLIESWLRDLGRLSRQSD